MFKIFSLILIFLLHIIPSNAEVINDIKILNNDRISKETILVFSDIKLGKNYSENDLNKIIKDLYSTDFFSEISLEIKDNVLFINVVENQIIQEILIEGIKKKEMVELLKENILSKDKNPYVENNARIDTNIIKKILKNSGYYFS